MTCPRGDKWCVKQYISAEAYPQSISLHAERCKWREGHWISRRYDSTTGIEPQKPDASIRVDAIDGRALRANKNHTYSLIQIAMWIICKVQI